MKGDQLQFDLNPRVLACATDPSTSHAAAARTIEFRTDHHLKILGALEDRDGHIYELAARTGLTHVQVARRIPELAQAPAKIRATGEIRVGPTGRGCRVWELVR